MTVIMMINMMVIMLPKENHGLFRHLCDFCNHLYGIDCQGVGMPLCRCGCSRQVSWSLRNVDKSGEEMQDIKQYGILQVNSLHQRTMYDYKMECTHLTDYVRPWQTAATRPLWDTVTR